MKKMFLLGALFAAGLGFTACSSEKDVAENPDAIENGGGNYIAISINLPNNPAANTRTNDNGDNVEYDDGLASEYAVKDASLLIFGSGGTFKEAYDLSSDWTQVTTSGTDYKNVTEYSKKFVLKTSGKIATNDLMLVILNKQSLFTITGTSVIIGGSPFSGTYSDFCNLTTETTGLDASPMTTTGFFMANAPLANAAGSGTTAPSATVRVLVPVTAVYDTEAAATSATPDQIYVERGMAKVTMDGTPTTNRFTNSKTSASADITFSVSGWTLDNTNPKSYLVRSTDGESSFHSLISTKSGSVYRYIGNSQITTPTAQTYGYRTYFAKSYGYDAAKTLNRVTSPSNFATTFGSENPKYCFENTFPVSLQNVNNTTLVQLEVTATVSGSTNLYTLNNNTDVVYTDNEIVERIKSAAAAYINTNKTTYVETEGSGILSTDFKVEVSNFTRNTDGNISGIVISYTPTSGYATLKSAAFSSGTTLNTTICSAVLTNVGTICQYVGGKSYYYVRIKHFGDNLTPWNSGETPGPSTTGGVYPSTDQDNNYLGRYGVLRNNWYNIKVNSIKSLGSAVPYTADYPNTPDDELDQYITFQINVLSWAKHQTQNADL